MKRIFIVLIILFFAKSVFSASSILLVDEEKKIYHIQIDGMSGHWELNPLCSDEDNMLMLQLFGHFEILNEFAKKEYMELQHCLIKTEKPNKSFGATWEKENREFGASHGWDKRIAGKGIYTLGKNKGIFVKGYMYDPSLIYKENQKKN